jgi:SsrA-binding protein
MAQKKKKIVQQKAVVNRRARFDYELGDEIIAGIVLTGPETRAARDGHVQLKGSFVTIRNNELWLNNTSFSLRLQQHGQPSARAVDTAPRKLLASRKQIDTLATRKKDGMSIIPTKLLTTGRFIKIIIALGKGKKNYDKREAIKRREQERDSQRAIKHL